MNKQAVQLFYGQNLKSILQPQVYNTDQKHEETILNNKLSSKLTKITQIMNPPQLTPQEQPTQADIKKESDNDTISSSHLQKDL